jgi:hypothetical protein
MQGLSGHLGNIGDDAELAFEQCRHGLAPGIDALTKMVG